MKRLYLMRHGHSPSTQEAGVPRDSLRPLSDAGRRDVRRMAEEILRRGGHPCLVLHSPLLRAAQTAAAAAEALKPGTGSAAFALLDNTKPAQEVLAALHERGGAADEVLAVGHQPQLGEIAALLTGGLFDIRPGGAVAVDLAGKPRLAWSLNPDELGG